MTVSVNFLACMVLSGVSVKWDAVSTVLSRSESYTIADESDEFLWN